MLQLLGGVAVAGAVAAGTTAFTASGVSGAVSVLAGGEASITVVGATLSGAKLIQNSSNLTPGSYGAVTGVEVNLTATPALSDSNTKVSAEFTGTGGDASPTTAFFDCGSGTSGKWTCTIASSKSYDSVTSVKIRVAALP
jgi:hypothetical protein